MGRREWGAAVQEGSMGGGVRRRGGVEGVGGSSVGREHGWGCEEEGWGRGSGGQQCRKGAWVGV